MYYWPLKFVFAKECAKVKTEYDKFENTIKNNIANFNINMGFRKYIVYFQCNLAMTDESVCNIVTQTECAAPCYVCGS